MVKTQSIKIILGAAVLSLSAFGAACSTGTTTAQTPRRVRPVESPTPEYKPPKRVSRDVIKTETTEETVKIKTK